MNAPEDTSFELPMLFVHWEGGLPEIGLNVVPNFQLVCPATYSVRPRCDIEIDSKLDHSSPSPHPRQITKGNWTFSLPFGLTTDGEDCRPGTYLIQIKIRFLGLSDRNLPSLFHCELRLNVPRRSGNRRELVIEGDGQSLINIDGLDLNEFAGVVIKGGPDAIVNLEGGGEQSSAPASSQETGIVSHRLHLAVSTIRTPFCSDTFTNGSRTGDASLLFDDGHRTLLFAKRTSQWRWTLGRRRQDNDIITRFLPASATHDAQTAKLSRTHAELVLTDTGLLLRDHSRSGIWVENFDKVDGDRLFTADEDSHGGIAIALGDVNSDQFRMDLQLFSAPDDQVQLNESKEADLMYSEILGQNPKQLQLTFHSRLQAARLRRETNLEDEENYVLLFSQATVGVSEEKNPVVLDNHPGNRSVKARFLYAERRFWLENQGERQEDVTVNDIAIPQLELIPLEFGMRLQLGASKLTFDRKAQVFLDD